MAASRRRSFHQWADPGVVTLAVLAFILAYWVLGIFRLPTPGYAAAPTVLPPLARTATLIAVPLLLALIAVWATGVDDAPVPTRRPWFLRLIEAPWSDWDALTWDDKMTITRRRQAVTWTFAILAAAAIFVPLTLLATMT